MVTLASLLTPFTTLRSLSSSEIAFREWSFCAVNDPAQQQRMASESIQNARVASLVRLFVAKHRHRINARRAQCRQCNRDPRHGQ